MSDDALREAERGEQDTQDALAAHVRAVRLGHGANCSSVGSVVDTLFVGAVVGGAIFAAVCAALRDEPVRVVGESESDESTEEPPG